MGFYSIAIRQPARTRATGRLLDEQLAKGRPGEGAGGRWRCLHEPHKQGIAKRKFERQAKRPRDCPTGMARTVGGLHAVAPSPRSDVAREGRAGLLSRAARDSRVRDRVLPGLGEYPALAAYPAYRRETCWRDRSVASSPRGRLASPFEYRNHHFRIVSGHVNGPLPRPIREPRNVGEFGDPIEFRKAFRKPADPRQGLGLAACRSKNS